MRNTLGANPVQIGVLYALTALAAASTLLISGSISDRYDRKKVMIAGWLAWIPAPLIFAFARNWLEMIPGIMLWGFWLGQPASSAYIVTSSERNKLTSTFTIISAGWSLGYMFSPAIGGFMAGTVGMKTVFFLSFALYSSACFLLTFVRSQYTNQSGSKNLDKQYSFMSLARNKKLLSLSGFFALLMFTIMMFRNFVPTYLADIYRSTDFEIGILGSVLFASSAVLGILLGKYGDMKRKSHSLAISLVSGAVALVLMLLSGNFAILILSFVFNGGSYITWSMLSAIVGPTAPESCRAKWIAVPQTLCMFASFAAPYVGGLLYSISTEYPFFVAIGAMPLFALLSLKVIRD